ncbi:MAG: PQQ-dependent sugar dehydrogenase [Bdellovibrionota bacterium]
MSSSRKVLSFGILALSANLALGCNSGETSKKSGDFQSDWAVEKGFKLSVDTDGFRFPTSIAFVPHPGKKPKDPLYFVAEYHNKIKVVTNDRSIYTFAEKFYESLPTQKGTTLVDQALDTQMKDVSGDSWLDAGGITGICLDPEHGYVFATLAYGDSKKILRSSIVRFQSKPEIFSTSGTAKVSFAEIFAAEATVFSHNAGTCQVANNTLFVGVGDGFQNAFSGDIHSVHGKILRMTLDGRPVRDNPFYKNDEVRNISNFVWASGFRNPFSLSLVGNALFVADNGLDLDRFVKIRKSENYLWSGSDWDIGARADTVFHPTICPAQMDYCPENYAPFPAEYRRKFFIASAKNAGTGIVMLDYQIESGKTLSTPRYILQSRTERLKRVVGLALGPDGLYFVPIDQGFRGTSPVLKLTYDPEKPHPYLLGLQKDADTLMKKKGCLGCHTFEDAIVKVGPSLSADSLIARIDARLKSPEYLKSLVAIDQLDYAPYASYRGTRIDIMKKSGRERVALWIRNHILEPRFDQMVSQMPNLGLTESEAEIITQKLMDPTQRGQFEHHHSELIQSLVLSKLSQVFGGTLRYRHLGFAFLFGALAVTGVFMLRGRKSKHK